MSQMDIIVVNYKNNAGVRRLLQSLSVHKPAPATLQCLIYDNSSDGNHFEGIDGALRVETIQNKKNIGFAAAVNRGIRKSRSPYIVLLNPDTQADSRVFKPIVDFMDDHPGVGVLGPKILNDDGTVQGSARSHPNFLTGAFGRSSILSRLFPNNPITRRNVLDFHFKTADPFPVDWVSGACMVVRREAIEAVGLLDEQFFMYWEDADWCRRMREKGWQVVYYPAVSVRHSKGQSSRKRPFRSNFEFHKSAYRLYAKYAGGYEGLLRPLILTALMIRFFFITLILALSTGGNGK